MYTKNENYFNIINTEAKAYFLGLLYSDGTVASDRYLGNGKIILRNQISIAVKEDDKHILESFLKELNSNYKIYNIKNQLKSPNWKNQVVVTVTSKQIKNDLIKLGCIPNKTINLSFPTESIVPNEFLNHFIRGYFDGDGCIWIGSRKEMTYNDGILLKKRTRIIHNMKFHITGLYSFINTLQDVLINNINLSKTKLYHTKKNDDIVTMEYSGKNNIKKFYEYIYKDSTIFLLRKKIIFDQILQRANI